MAKVVTVLKPGDPPSKWVPATVRNGRIINQPAYELPLHIRAAALETAPPVNSAPAPVPDPVIVSDFDLMPMTGDPDQEQTTNSQVPKGRVLRSAQGKPDNKKTDEEVHNSSAPALAIKNKANQSKKRKATAADLSDAENAEETSEKPKPKYRIVLPDDAWENYECGDDMDDDEDDDAQKQSSKGKKVAPNTKTAAKKGKSNPNTPAPTKKAPAKSKGKTKTKSKVPASASNALKSQGFKIWVSAYSLDLASRAFKNLRMVKINEQDLASLSSLFQELARQKKFQTQGALGGKILFDQPNPKSATEGACTIGNTDLLRLFVANKRKEFQDGVRTHLVIGAAMSNMSVVLCDKAEEGQIKKIISKEGFETTKGRLCRFPAHENTVEVQVYRPTAHTGR